MEKSFYGDKKIILDGALLMLTSRVDWMKKYLGVAKTRNPISYVTSRIKTEDSMKEKLRRKGYEVNIENALGKIYDAVGVRIICPYLKDVYSLIDLIRAQSDFEIIREKNYIDNPKANGYRSYHIVIRLNVNFMGNDEPVFAEIQLRTIAMDCWASLEHEMKYKNEVKNQEMIEEELRRCADELATADLNMQTIKNMIDTI